MLIILALFCLLAKFVSPSSAPPFYFVNDPRWAAITLGNSVLPMKNYGQLICAIASGLAWKGVSTRDGLVNPANLNAFIRERTKWDGKNHNFPYDVLEELGYALSSTYNYSATNNTLEADAFIRSNIERSIILVFKLPKFLQPNLLYEYVSQKAIFLNPMNASDSVLPIKSLSYFITLKPLQSTPKLACDDLCYLNPCNCRLFPCSKAQALRDSCMIYSKGLISGCTASSSRDNAFFECALNACPCTYTYLDPNECLSLSQQTPLQYKSSALIGISLDLYVWIDKFVPNKNLLQATLDSLRTHANASIPFQEITYNRLNISVTEMREISQQAVEIAGQEIFSALSSYSELPISLQHVALAIYIENYRRKEYLVSTDLWTAFQTKNYNYLYKLLNQIPTLYDYYSEVYGVLRAKPSAAVDINEYSKRRNGQGNVSLFPNGGNGGWEDRTADYISYPSLRLKGLKVPKYAGEAIRYALNCNFEDTIANIFILIDNSVYGDYAELNLYINFLQTFFTRDPIAATTNINWRVFIVSSGLVPYQDLTSSVVVVKNAFVSMTGRVKPLLTQSNLTNTFDLLMTNYQTAQNNTNVVLYFGVGNSVSKDLSQIQLLKEQYGFHFIVLTGNSPYRDVSYLRSLSSDFLVYNLEAVNSQMMPTTLLRSISEGVVKGSVNGSLPLRVVEKSYRYLSFPITNGGNYIQITRDTGDLRASDLGVYAAINFRNPSETAYEFLGVYSDGKFIVSFQFPNGSFISGANKTSANISGFLYVSIKPSISGMLVINSSEGSAQLRSCPLGCLSCDNTGTSCYVCDKEQQFSTFGDNCTSPLLQSIMAYSNGFKIYHMPPGTNDTLFASIGVVFCLFWIVIVVAFTTVGRGQRYSKPKEKEPEQTPEKSNILPENLNEQYSARNLTKRIDLSMLRTPRLDHSLNSGEN